MKTKFLTVALAATLATAGCMENTTQYQQDQTTGAIAGGALGLITAKVLGADTKWTVISTLAGAAAGTLVARNASANQCAYARGDGTYYTAPCP